METLNPTSVKSFVRPATSGGRLWPWYLVALAVAAAVFALLQTAAPSLLAGIEERSSSLVWQIKPVATEERRVVLIDIDEDSLRQIGPWPWPRERMAELARKLRQQGVREQIYDMVFPDSRPGDADFSQALAAAPAVVAQIFDLNAGTRVTQGQLLGGVPGCDPSLPQVQGYIANNPSISGLQAGHITPRIDADGAVRKLPAVICHGGKAYPALAIAALQQAQHPAPLTLEKGEGLWAPHWRLHSGSITAPLDEKGDIRLPYRLSPEALISIPASDVFNDRIPQGLLEGAWALVGTTAFGLGDAVPTPHGGAAAGMSVHAQLISALLDERVPYTPRVAPWLQVAMALAGLLLLGIVLTVPARRPVYLLPLAAILIGAALFALQAALLLEKSVWLGWVRPAAFIFLAGLFLSAAEMLRLRLEKERLYTHLSSYLPARVAAALALQPASEAIQAQRENVTVLFADIRNFSGYCEARPPEEAAAVLHTFFSSATRIVEAHGGFIEAYQGDAVMAIWPFDASSSEVIIAAARELLVEAEKNLPVPPAGLEPMALGIGIENGPALIGSFGPARRRTHAALGTTVTIASRLQGLTADLAQPILIGPNLASRCQEKDLQYQGKFLLEGMQKDQSVYALNLESSDSAL